VRPTADLEAGEKPGHNPKKGRPTPKRSEAQRRRRNPEPPPTNRKEAAKRMRDRQKEERAETRAGMLAGDDRYLMARDKGPVRKLVRDIVDSRRNVGTFFFGGALLVILASSGGMPTPVRFGANVLWLGLIVTLILDAFLISRRVRKLVAERFPKSTDRPMSLYFYAFTRSTMFRRLRSPKPTIKVGEAI
jgi:hypothetical protein